MILHHIHPLVTAHMRGDCHDSSGCPRCSDERAHMRAPLTKEVNE